MRYSIIHHDVRERFGLGLNQYAVADSIHQLSNGHPTLRPNTDIARFLGLTEGTVRNAKIELLEKGLIEQTDSGVQTTNMWYEAVTWASRKNYEGSQELRENRKTSESHNISKEVINTSANELPILEQPEEGARQRREKAPTAKVGDVVGGWNKYADTTALKRRIVLNESAKKEWLPVAKESQTLSAAILRKRTKYTQEEFEHAFDRYALEVMNRKPDKGSYHLHRFTLYEFLTHKEVFERYVTR